MYNNHKMKRAKSFTDESKMEAFRLPMWMSEEARKKAHAEDLTFSQLVRRAIRNELNLDRCATEIPQDAN